MRLVLLPGMDGTGELFASFLRALPSSLGATVVSYGAETSDAALCRDASDEEVEHVRAVLREVPRATLRARLQRVLCKDATPALAACVAPVLYLEARRDRLLPHRVLRELLHLRPRLAHAVIDGPHLLLQRCARACADAIVAFIATLPTSDW